MNTPGGGGGSNYTGAATNVTVTDGSQLASHGASAGDGFVAIAYVAPAADVSVTNTGSPNPVSSKQQLTYTITATNTGGHDATGVTVTDPLPASARFNSMATTQGTCTTSPGTSPKTKYRTVTCSIGTLAGGATATVTIVVTSTTPGTLTNTATVTASNVTQDSDDSATTTVQAT